MTSNTFWQFDSPDRLPRPFHHWVRQVA